MPIKEYQILFLNISWKKTKSVIKKSRQKKNPKEIREKKGKTPKSKIALGYSTLVLAKIAVMPPATAKEVNNQLFRMKILMLYELLEV